MSSQLVDLTKIRPKDAAPWTFDQGDLILLLTTGGVGYLVKEALKHCFLGTPSVTEQLEVLANLIDACGRAGAKSLQVRISTDAKFATWRLFSVLPKEDPLGRKTQKSPSIGISPSCAAHSFR